MLELTDLVRRATRHSYGKIALLDALRGAGKPRERLGERPRGAIGEREREGREDKTAGGDRERDLALGVVERRKRQEDTELLRLARVRLHEREDRLVALPLDGGLAVHRTEQEVGVRVRRDARRVDGDRRDLHLTIDDDRDLGVR